MRVEYEYSTDMNEQLYIYHQDTIVGAIQNGVVKMRFNNFARMLQAAHIQGKIDSPLIIARIKKGQKNMQG